MKANAVGAASVRYQSPRPLAVGVLGTGGDAGWSPFPFDHVTSSRNPGWDVQPLTSAPTEVREGTQTKKSRNMRWWPRPEMGEHGHRPVSLQAEMFWPR
jgi:hypothetical protein